MESKTPFKDKKNFADVILILSLLVVGLSVFLIVTLTRDSGADVIVTVDGEEVARYSLSRDGEFNVNGGTNVVVIKDGEVFVKSASCPDRLCVYQGKKSKSGERIICLPNRVEIRVVGDGEEILSH